MHIPREALRANPDVYARPHLVQRDLSSERVFWNQNSRPSFARQSNQPFGIKSRSRFIRRAGRHYQCFQDVEAGDTRGGNAQYRTFDPHLLHNAPAARAQRAEDCEGLDVLTIVIVFPERQQGTKSQTCEQTVVLQGF
jgi:hypothetical protein